jgi:hypothetical protein
VKTLLKFLCEETQQVENIHHKTYVWNGRDKLTNWEDSG